MCSDTSQDTLAGAAPGGWTSPESAWHSRPFLLASQGTLRHPPATRGLLPTLSCCAPHPRLPAAWNVDSANSA